MENRADNQPHHFRHIQPPGGVAVICLAPFVPSGLNQIISFLIGFPVLRLDLALDSNALTNHVVLDHSAKV